MIGRTGRILNTYNSTSTILKECLVLPRLQLKMMLSSIWCGLMRSKLLMVVRRLGASVMVLLDWVWFVSLRKPMQIALIKQVPTYFTLLPPLRTFLYMGQTSPMNSLRPHHQNRGFSFAQIVLSMSGGSTINNCHQFLPVPSLRFFFAMQGHPESPHLWEKHANKILQEIGLTPTVHKSCLYLGTINGQWILFMRQVDDFAITVPDAKTSNILMDMINNCLKIPIKRQGYLDMYNGVDLGCTLLFVLLLQLDLDHHSNLHITRNMAYY
jgi:hypothetical protein